MPVVSDYLVFDTATKTLVPAERLLFDLPLGPAVAMFFLVSAIAHFTLAFPARGWYERILARSMNLPAVVGLGSASELIEDDDWLVLDGEAGVVIVAPDEPLLAEYRRRQAADLAEREKLLGLVSVPGDTRDGTRVELHANIELPEEAQQARDLGADGIGLFRSEFLFMNRKDLPGEE